ncbi:hypothetical protein CC78DRAFT_530246 [Lojkania enalia]|uniref:RING-type domain-containing protein n=1 Tax=Lojkania enalia TaxID=147567 RepID=A0A9P4KJB5_9PLEO|nr:hypothetical protein CC78DRAFT_530246 [Didymosphaeria enalia]
MPSPTHLPNHRGWEICMYSLERAFSSSPHALQCAISLTSAPSRSGDRKSPPPAHADKYTHIFRLSCIHIWTSLQLSPTCPICRFIIDCAYYTTPFSPTDKQTLPRPSTLRSRACS